MKKGTRNLLLVFFIIFQVIPLVIIAFYMYQKTKLTGNSGWTIERNGDCKFYTNNNYEKRNFIWSGNCKEGLVDGYGELRVFQNGGEYYLYEGFISEGIIQGYGKLILLSDGDTYEGNYVNGKPHGQGHFYNDDGDHYKGNFKEGLMSGNGTYWYAPESELFKYVGEWKENKKHGKGTLFYRNGRKVSGNFIKGVLQETNK